MNTPWRRANKRYVRLAAVVLFAAAVGVLTILASQAASYTQSNEAENGAVLAPASKQTVAGASGGEAVKFGAANPSPNPNPLPGTVCTNPVFTTSDTNGGWSNGGYYVHNNMWNASEGGPETLFACSYKSWYVESTQPNTTSVKTYPNVHLDINNLNGRPLSNYSTITSTFAGKGPGPGTGIYNVAYDLWLNGVGWGNGTTEMMIWTENVNQRPLGSIKATYTGDGQTMDVWHYNSGGANVVSFVTRTTVYSGSFNLKAMIDWAIGKGYIPANPTVNQIGYGVEICSTNNVKRRFDFTDFSVNIQ